MFSDYRLFPMTRSRSFVSCTPHLHTSPLCHFLCQLRFIRLFAAILWGSSVLGLKAARQPAPSLVPSMF